MGRAPRPSCPDGSAPEIVFSGPATATSCNCSCGPWAGGACTAPELTCWIGEDECNEAGANVTAVYGSGACVEVPSSVEDLSCSISAAAQIANPGACQPSAPVAAPMWTEQVHACRVSGTGECAAGEACVVAGTCISFDGDVPCPTTLPERLVAFGGGQDQRSCTACTCSATGSCVGGGYRFHRKDDCNGGQQELVNGSGCVDVSNLLDDDDGAVRLEAAQATGSCVVGGGVASGTVIPSSPRTYCCSSGGAP